jgi:hypothetical protein
MTNFRVDADHPFPKPTRIWGLGKIVGDRKDADISESDYDDYQAVDATIIALFAMDDVDASISDDDLE